MGHTAEKLAKLDRTTEKLKMLTIFRTAVHHIKINKHLIKPKAQLSLLIEILKILLK